MTYEEHKQQYGTLTNDELKTKFQDFTRALRSTSGFTREQERDQAIMMLEIAVRELDFLAWEKEVA